MKPPKDIGTLTLEFEDGNEVLDVGDFHRVLVDAYTRTEGLPEVEKYREMVKTVQEYLEPLWGWKPSGFLVSFIEAKFLEYWEGLKRFFGPGSESQQKSEP